MTPRSLTRLPSLRRSPYPTTTVTASFTRTRSDRSHPPQRSPRDRLPESKYSRSLPNLRLHAHSRVIFQGFTGRQATANAAESLQWGTRVVGGVKPGAAAADVHLGLPVLPSVREAMRLLKPDATGVYVAASQAAAAIEEAVEAEVPLVVAVAEHIPLHDMLRIHSVLSTQTASRLVGANAPGIISPTAHCRIGFQPLGCYAPGTVGIAAKSGTLSYEAAASLTRAGLGQSLCIGVGGDMVAGTDFVDALNVFETDDETQGVVLVGEIGGRAEEEAADWIRAYRKRCKRPKPIAALVAGLRAPPGRVMGHAGAFVGVAERDAVQKYQALEAAGAVMVKHPAKFGEVMKELLAKSERSGSAHSNGIQGVQTGNRRGFHSTTRTRPTTSTTIASSPNLPAARAAALLAHYGINLSPPPPISPQNPIHPITLGITIDRTNRCPAYFFSFTDPPTPHTTDLVPLGHRTAITDAQTLDQVRKALYHAAQLAQMPHDHKKAWQRGAPRPGLYADWALERNPKEKAKIQKLLVDTAYKAEIPPEYFLDTLVSEPKHVERAVAAVLVRARPLLEKLWRVFVGAECVSVGLRACVNPDAHPRAVGAIELWDPRVVVDDAAVFRREDEVRELLSGKGKEEEKEEGDSASSAAPAAPAANTTDAEARTLASSFKAAEQEAKRHGIVYIPLGLSSPNSSAHNIGTLVNGAGLAMNTVDALAQTPSAHHCQAANFLDTGGKATADTVRESFKLLLADPRVKVVFVNIFGGLTLCDMIARGILAAFAELRLGETGVRVVVRLRGSNEREGMRVLRESGMGVWAVEGFEEAVGLCVGFAREVREREEGGVGWSG